ncbi:MAG: DedA family protein [Candidatus Paceibacterota bacterium]|jgi:membrane protein DedA with SNARE-associated domain
MVHSLINFLTPAIVFVSQFKYFLLFLGVIVEGPFLMIASGFLLHKGVFDFLPLFVALVTGDLVADVGWYYLGYFFMDPILKKHGHFLSVTPEVLEKTKALFHRFHTKILFISKITIGFGMAIATLMLAGATHIPIKKFLVLNLIGETVLVAALLALGYFFGGMYDSIVEGFKTIFLIGAVVFSLVLVWGVSHYTKQKITQL